MKFEVRTIKKGQNSRLNIYKRSRDRSGENRVDASKQDEQKLTASGDPYDSFVSPVSLTPQTSVGLDPKLMSRR